MKQFKEYSPGYELKENEYLLKIRPEDRWHSVPTGFIAKLTKKGEVPEAFKKWGTEQRYKDGKWGWSDPLPTYIMEETFSSGWKLQSWRFGQSQNWASLIHPFGFTLEIYLQQFLEILKTTTVVNGEIQGEFKWEANKLIKK